MSVNPTGRPNRVYDKGERRYKHAGLTSEAEIVFEHDNPKRAIGKCPNNIHRTEREALLEKAIPASLGDRDLAVPKSLFVVHKGVIYEAQTSDGGTSYHAYPFHGRLKGRLIKALRAMPTCIGYEKEFDDWVKAHIEAEGSWK